MPNPHYYGWVIVGTGLACSLVSSPGQSFVLSLYVDHIIRDLGISRVDISTLYAVATLSAAAVLPLLGRVADRVSARRFMTIVLAGVGVFLGVLGLATGLVTLAIAFFGLRLLGQGAIGIGTLTSTVRWFSRYRGRALAIVTLGYAAGELVFPALVLGLITTFGWRGSLLLFAVLYLGIFAPVLGLPLRDRDPAREPLDGTVARAKTTKVESARPLDPGVSFAVAVRTPVFWPLLLCAALPPLLLTAVIFHQVALFEAREWSPATIPVAFAAFALTSASATFLSGFILERVPVRFGLGLGLLVGSAALAWYSWGPAGSVTAVGYGVLLGACSGISSATNSLVWPGYFGVRALGTLQGVVNAVRNGATALGPPFLAIIHAWTSDFGAALAVLAVLATALGVLAFFLRPPEPIRIIEPALATVT